MLDLKKIQHNWTQMVLWQKWCFAINGALNVWTHTHHRGIFYKAER